ncbi:natriuretic peptides A [Seriola lalandi dorsalis]|uniref:Natriuretic peptide A n=1 Tax=Seriola lalandi dorsalis TaxID=1841481 RepID=A0A3B4XXS6_SERLL|nr:natriuretic peptides A [Seriola lalandi dorsalis]XP_056241337.1 natriuretic peptides A [Seriola aureovittata]
MRTAVLWGLLALLCQHTLVSSHILGRASSTSDLAQLKSLLERFEETLAAAAQEEDSEADYEGTNQEPERSQTSRGWSINQEGDQEPLISDRSQAPAEGHNRATSQRSRLQDLLMATRKRASSCFGARMDRIGNASGLGCNNGRG